MILRDLYKIVDKNELWTVKVQSGGQPFPQSGLRYQDNGMTCQVSCWLSFIDRVDTCWQRVGKREVVSISNNVIVIK
jgi:hypothetical protein